MANAAAAIRSARMYLNDINGVTWSDSILMPMLQEAHGELTQELNIHNSGVLKTQTAQITVPAGSVNLGINQPSGLINPISMMEGNPGDDPDLFQDMVKVSFLPLIDQDIWLFYWAWMGDVIQFIGATQDRQVILRYEGFINTPQTLNDPLGCIFAERYIGPRIAAIAYTVIGKDNKKLQDLADSQLYKLIQGRVVDDQRPTRRKAYRSNKNIFGISGNAIPIGPIPPLGGSVLPDVKTTTVPDGISVTGFSFGFLPKAVFWNGVKQYENEGYTLSVVNEQYMITFIDINGNVLTPGTGDDIREVI